MVTHGKILIKTPCVPFYAKFIKEMFSIIRNANITGNNIISGNLLGLPKSFFSSIIGVYVLTEKSSQCETVHNLNTWRALPVAGPFSAGNILFFLSNFFSLMCN